MKGYGYLLLAGWGGILLLLSGMQVRAGELEVVPQAGATGDPGSAHLLRQGVPYRIEVFTDEKKASVAAGAKVTLLERPGTELEKKLVLGRTDSKGVLLWSPKADGQVKLVATGAHDEKIAENDYSLLYSSLPLAGILVGSLVALLFFGGGALLILSLIRTPAEEEDPGSP